MKRTAFASGVALALLLALGARAGEVRDLDDLLKKTKVTIQKACDEAQKTAPGTIVRARLVKGDDGAPSWRVVVHKGAEMTEVWVDGVSAQAVAKQTWKDESDAEKARPPRPSDSD